MGCIPRSQRFSASRDCSTYHTARHGNYDLVSERTVIGRISLPARENCISNQVGPAQAAKCVLGAFAYAYAGAEITPDHVEKHFRRRGHPPEDPPRGILVAAVSDWIERSEKLSLRLTLSGIAALGKQTPVPTSIFSAWAHSL